MDNTTTANITLTESAIQRLGKLFETGKTKGKHLRVCVEGGGCFGFQYDYKFVETPDKDDLVIGNHPSLVFIDKLSVEFIKGSSIDYVETLGFASFEIKNPNSKSGCGCGNSFSV